MIDFGRHVFGGRGITYIAPILKGREEDYRLPTDSHKRWETYVVQIRIPYFDLSATRQSSPSTSLTDVLIDVEAPLFSKFVSRTNAFPSPPCI